MAPAGCARRQFAWEIQQAGFLLRKEIAGSLAVRGRQFQLPPPAGLYKRYGGFWKSITPAGCARGQFASEIQQAGFLLRKKLAGSLAVRGRQFQLPPPAGLYKRHGGFWKSVAPLSEAGPRGTRPCFRSRTDAAAHCCTGFTLGG